MPAIRRPPTSGSPGGTKTTFNMTVTGDVVTATDGTNSANDISIVAQTTVGATPLGSVMADEIEDVQFNLGSNGDTVNITGDFSTTSLSPSTITVNGGIGGDTVNASGLSSAHAINFNGGGGDDTFVSSNAAADDTFTAGANGANGDTANYSAVASSITVDLSDTIGSNVSGGAGNDTLTDVENVTGGQVGDSITGSSLANVLSGGGGNDTLTGGGGSDTIYGGTATADSGTADAANFAGTLSTYQVTFDPFQAADADGLDAMVDGGVGNVDTTHGVELLQFTGATLDLSDNVFLFELEQPSGRHVRHHPVGGRRGRRLRHDHQDPRWHLRGAGRGRRQDQPDHHWPERSRRDHQVAGGHAGRDRRLGPLGR